MADTRYIPGLGRRKEATAQVRLFPNGSGKITINKKEVAVYFPVYSMQHAIKQPFITSGVEGKFDVEARVTGGGIRGQSDAVRLGIARALVEFNADYRTSLKKLGYLKRDARVRERKKYGKKSARRSPQWAKR